MKKNKGFSLIITIITILIIGIICGIVFWAAKKTAPKPIVQSSINPLNPNCGTNPASSIKILSPNGGEVYESGQQITVKWESCNIAPIIPIYLELSDNNGYSVYFKTEATFNNNSVSINLPIIYLDKSITNQNIPLYKMYLSTSVEGQAYSAFDYSDNLFAIIPIESIQSQNKFNKEKYESTKGQYAIKYPPNWVVVSKSEDANYSNFQIKNSANAVLPGANSEMGGRDSVISVQVSYGSLPNGINYSDYSSIDETIMDSKFKLSKTERDYRLTKISSMEIGKKNLKVLKLGNLKGEVYSFVNDGKVFNISLMSGSSFQFNLDRKVFSELLSSLVFN